MKRAASISLSGLALGLWLAAGCGGSEPQGSANAGGAGSGASGGTGGTGGTGGSGAGGGGGAGGSASSVDLCAGLVTDTSEHPMSALGKPGLLEAVTDPEFGTTLRRITDVGGDGVIKPMYSTIPAWNADESYLILYEVNGGHRLHDGRTYELIRMLDIDPPDLEQVYWHPSEPDVLFYIEGKTLIRYHVSSDTKEAIHEIASCAGPASAGEDPMYIAWDAGVMGVGCDGNGFALRIDDGTEGPAIPLDPFAIPQAAPSGELLYVGGEVRDFDMNLVRTLDLYDPINHASLGRLASGHDAYQGVVYDAGPNGSGLGALVTHDMTDGSARVIIGPDTGYPYPPSGIHISALALQRPGHVFVSVVGDPSGEGVLDGELLVADSNPGGVVCRIAHHRSHGKDGPQGYWAEPHVVPSPSGTRALFASDWGGGASVDAYVVELPSYAP